MLWKIESLASALEKERRANCRLFSAEGTAAGRDFAMGFKVSRICNSQSLDSAFRERRASYKSRGLGVAHARIKALASRDETGGTKATFNVEGTSFPLQKPPE